MGRLSAPRIAAMAIAMGCHLALLAILLRPAASPRVRADAEKRDPHPLVVRLVSAERARTSPSAAPAQAAPTPALTAAPPRPRHAFARPVVATPPSQPQEATAPAPPVAENTVPPQGPAATSDGGFRQRLLDAQTAGAVRGVPGSDRRLAPGVQLISPMDQGIGAAARRAQRLFGVVNSHCTDLDAWQRMTPEERIAHHVSRQDMEQTNEQYHCNSPMGLHF